MGPQNGGKLYAYLLLKVLVGSSFFTCFNFFAAFAFLAIYFASTLRSGLGNPPVGGFPSVTSHVSVMHLMRQFRRAPRFDQVILFAANTVKTCLLPHSSSVTMMNHSTSGEKFNPDRGESAPFNSASSSTADTSSFAKPRPSFPKAWQLQASW
jgi:hypothetical protein